MLQSKCGIRFASDFLKPRRWDPRHVDLSSDYIIRSVEHSLSRLRTDHLDILLLHRPDALLDPAEVACAFDHLKESGKVRYFGVSNHTGAQIGLLRRHVHQPLVVNQIQLGLGHTYPLADGIDFNRTHARIAEDCAVAAGVVDYCQLLDIQIQAWAPLRGRCLQIALADRSINLDSKGIPIRGGTCRGCSTARDITCRDSSCLDTTSVQLGLFR